MHHFFALLFRQKQIRRWGLMRSLREENLTEHAAETAYLAHALAVIGNTYLRRAYDPARAAELALFHDVPEVYTGDMPTPVKYFSPLMRQCYGEIEADAKRRLLAGLPAELLPAYADLLDEGKETDPALYPLVKAADKLSAYIKAMTEVRSGNTEFQAAEKALESQLDAMDLPELALFRSRFLPAFTATLDDTAREENDSDSTASHI